jgi:hypothetical protein
MFARITTLALLLWFGLASVLWFFQGRSGTQEVASPTPSKRTLGEQPLHQIRRGVQKDIWTISGKERLHFRLKSEKSLLSIEQNKRKFSAIETLGHLECCMQEAIDRSAGEQQIRYITAETGTYSFPAHRFVADEVLLSFYREKGTTLPLAKPTQIPFLSGKAEEVVFSEVDHAPAFSAYHLKAEFSPEFGKSQ